MAQSGNEAIQLDTLFHNLVFDIEGRLSVLEKHLRVRVQVRATLEKHLRTETVVQLATF